MEQPSRVGGSGILPGVPTDRSVGERVGECERSPLSKGELWYRAMIAVAALSLVATSIWI